MPMFGAIAQLPGMNGNCLLVVRSPASGTELSAHSPSGDSQRAELTARKDSVLFECERCHGDMGGMACCEVRHSLMLTPNRPPYVEPECSSVNNRVQWSDLWITGDSR